MLEKMKFVMSGVWGFLRPLIVVLLSNIGPLLIESAQAAVIAAEGENLTGDERKKLATKAVQQVLAQKGFEVGKEVISIVLKLAVVEMREKNV
jgi:hypothetical protein